jgi:hypothetical protein
MSTVTEAKLFFGKIISKSETMVPIRLPIPPEEETAIVVPEIPNSHTDTSGGN